MAKLKITGFGRLFIFLLIIAPIVYFGMKYLQGNGTLDKMKEKVEDIQSDRTDGVEIESSEDILKDIDRRSGNQANNGQDAVIAEQRRKIEELERKNRELQNRKESTSNLPPSTNNTGRAPSIDDLIRGAENSSGRTTSPDLSPPSSASTKSLASWAFSFNGVSGTIELYQQGNRLMSRATYQSMDRVDIFELIQNGERLFVKDSPTNEYYVLRDDGDLDAFDEGGFQTRCTRSN